ncbi:MAG: hypothetical protein ACXWDG_11210 [Aeromicrobium sp.]
MNGRNLACAVIAALGIVACDTATPSTHSATLELQVRNSGMPGGYVWFARAEDRSSGQWHRFGMAEFLCVTCPTPFAGSEAGFVIAVFDESCSVRGGFRTPGGHRLVEIDLGPVVRVIEAPPLQDWLPADSIEANPANVPCVPP